MVAFAQDSALSGVRTLSASDFFEILSNPDSTKPWFIDFFAPVSLFGNLRAILSPCQSGWSFLGLTWRSQQDGCQERMLTRLSFQWCPPCMRLLPEFRKAAKSLADNGQSIRFGTVDCTVNLQACQSANVQSYPTTVLYNGSKVLPFIGLHNMQELLDFIEVSSSASRTGEQ